MSLPHCPKCNSEYTYEDGSQYVCPECAHEWPQQAEESVEETKVVKDSVGNTLQDGDTVLGEPALHIAGILAAHLHIGADGFFEVDEAPTGFMLIKRSVFERLMAAYPERQYVPDSLGVDDRGLHYRFFDVMMDPESRRYLSEDYGFCRLWRSLGGKIHADANSSLSHQGSKLYRGNFAASLSTNLAAAVGAPLGSQMWLHGSEYLQPNERGPE